MVVIKVSHSTRFPLPKLTFIKGHTNQLERDGWKGVRSYALLIRGWSQCMHEVSGEAELCGAIDQ